jgi:hypothetical protein
MRSRRYRTSFQPMLDILSSRIAPTIWVPLPALPTDMDTIADQQVTPPTSNDMPTTVAQVAVPTSTV